jgi:signal peptidase I
MGDKSRDRQEHHHGGAKETIESIVIALVLAFVFRAFVVEAFVIPTGSMAPTLMGAHSRYVCENCGYRFDVNYSSSGSPTLDGDINIPRRVGEAVNVLCPNCGFRILDQQSDNPNVYYGDRILVLKYIYLLNQPQRWDVVVFKSPADPKRYFYTQNYIKRLIGKPGEQIMLLDGDVYVAHKDNPADTDWEIQTKPDVAQDALWRIVNDMDYAPRGLLANGEPSDDPTASTRYIPWKASSGKVAPGRDRTGANAWTLDAGPSPEGLQFDPSVSARKSPLTDWLAYDQSPRQQQLRKYAVGDLKLSLFCQRQSGDGELRLNLSKRNDLFTASVSKNKVTLWHQRANDPASLKELSSRTISLPDRPVRLDFVNLDYKVRLLVDGQEVLHTTSQQYHPDVAALKAEADNRAPLPTVSINARNLKASLTHISLWRDVYYTPTVVNGERALRGLPDNPMKLSADEYFVLGDNSPLSGDGRYWSASFPVDLPAEGVHADAGIVPGRFLLGKAMFVYWPAGFRAFNSEYPDLVPNFGEMRFIH